MDNRLTLAGFLPGQLGKQALATTGTTFVGIDFGTSTTVVSFATLGTDNLVAVDTLAAHQFTRQGGTITSDKIPTVIAFSRRDQEIYIGQGAANLKFQLEQGKFIWYSFKMKLGENELYQKSVLINQPGFADIRTPQDAATVFFTYLKGQIASRIQELGLSSRTAWAVSIPASFEANQRQDLIAALQRADITVANNQCLIDEPNAAVLSVLQHWQTDDGPPVQVPEHRPLNILVFDFGAGTCDISILEIGLDRTATYYSKNLSISRFEALGGDDIDAAVALKILLPQFQAQGLDVNELSTRQRKEDVLPQLLKAAETLKIELCRDISFHSEEVNSSSLPTLASSTTKKQLANPLTVTLSPSETYTVQRPTASYEQFEQVMSTFLDEDCDREVLHGYTFLSIFEPIESALEKAALERDDIDYVLLVGGSAKNPYVQAALRKSFPGKRRLLIPAELQTHVSKGAAIHSLLFHGLGRNLIQPIISEPLCVITRGGQLETLVKEGTEIPCEVKRITGLRPQRDGQTSLEVPLCLGHIDRILYVLSINSPTSKGFSRGDEVEVECHINLDKVVSVQAHVGGLVVQVQLSPFANKHLSAPQRAVYEAARQNKEVAFRNGGRPTARSLMNLSRAYQLAQNAREAAETMKEAYDLDPTSTSLNNLAVAFNSAGDRKRALKYYEQAYQEKPDAITVMNLAVTIKYVEPERATKLMQEAYEKGPDNSFVLCEYASFLSEKNPGESRRLYTKAVGILEKQFTAGNLPLNDHFRLRSAASKTGRTELADAVLAAEKAIGAAADFFNDNNTLERGPQLLTF
jgi:molecular chaperone DnaK